MTHTIGDRGVGAPVLIKQRTPFPIAEVNVYLLPGDPLTLVDSGTFDDLAWEDLEAGLAGAGYAVEDIEQVLITHHHADHAGLARRIRERSGAAIVGHESLPPYLDDVPMARGIERDYQLGILAVHGASEETLEAQRALQARLVALIESVELDRLLSEGESVLAGGRELKTVFRPGHSRTDTLFVDETRGVAFGGDHLLTHTSSDPTSIRPVGPDADPRRRVSALLEYRDALRETATMELAEILTGHGEPVRDHGSLIAKRLETHDRHAARLLKELTAEPQTASEIALRIWPAIAAERPFLTVSLVLNSLDVLNEKGLVEEHAVGDNLAYTAV